MSRITNKIHEHIWKFQALKEKKEDDMDALKKVIKNCSKCNQHYNWYLDHIKKASDNELNNIEELKTWKTVITCSKHIKTVQKIKMRREELEEINYFIKELEKEYDNTKLLEPWMM